MKKIYFYSTGGLADILRGIHRVYLYSKKNNFSEVYLDTEYYRESNFFDIFDFNYNDILFKKYDKKIEVTHKINGSDHELFCENCLKNKDKCINLLEKKIISKKSFECCCSVFYGAYLAFKNLKLKKDFLEVFSNYTKKNFIQDEHYTAIHIRGTDRIHEYKRYGYDSLDDYLEKNLCYLNEFDLPLYVATDEYEIIKKISKNTNKKIYFNKNLIDTNKNYKNLHSKGNLDPSILENALIDLLILSGSHNLLTSVGGFSRLAFQLWNDKLFYKQMIGKEKELGQHIKTIQDRIDLNFKIISNRFLKLKIYN